MPCAEGRTLGLSGRSLGHASVDESQDRASDEMRKKRLRWRKEEEGEAARRCRWMGGDRDGLFIASRLSIIACGTRMTMVAMRLKFIVGPAVMALSSFAIGLRGGVLRVAIVQAALPQGIVPFVFAKEYNVYPEILSTTVIFGMLIALPIALPYYFLLGL